jgi:hypothetical protein
MEMFLAAVDVLAPEKMRWVCFCCAALIQEVHKLTKLLFDRLSRCVSCCYVLCFNMNFPAPAVPLQCKCCGVCLIAGAHVPAVYTNSLLPVVWRLQTCQVVHCCACERGASTPAAAARLWPTMISHLLHASSPWFKSCFGILSVAALLCFTCFYFLMNG